MGRGGDQFRLGLSQGLASNRIAGGRRGEDHRCEGGQLCVGHQPEIGWSGVHAGELAQFAIRRQRHSSGAATFQPQQDR